MRADSETKRELNLWLEHTLDDRLFVARLWRGGLTRRQAVALSSLTGPDSDLRSREIGAAPTASQ
jgi:hypothetical protein